MKFLVKLKYYRLCRKTGVCPRHGTENKTCMHSDPLCQSSYCSECAAERHQAREAKRLYALENIRQFRKQMGWD